MTIPEAAELLGLKASTLRHQIRNRKLRAHRMGVTWYVSEAEVERYARENRRPATTADKTGYVGGEE